MVAADDAILPKLRDVVLDLFSATGSIQSARTGGVTIGLGR
jgi:hypothetical protein